jgi:hypothetical protein
MVQTRSDFDGKGADPIVDRVREAAEEDAAEIAVRNRPHRRRAQEKIEPSPELVLELGAEPDPL